MSLAHSMLEEFEVQAPITRKFLERLPEDKLTWKPHEKSMSAGRLGLHIAQIPGAVVRAVQHYEAQVPDFNDIPQPSSLREIVDTLDESVATVKELLPQANDARLQETLRLMQGDREVLAQPLAQFLRNIMLNHWYQHRGQFSVYLRLLNVAVPSSWGPSADELPAFLQKAQSA